MKEIWKDIHNVPFHQVSNLGNIKVVQHTIMRKDGKPFTVKERIRKPFITRNGYAVVNSRIHNKKIYIIVHRAVAEAFIDNPFNKEQVNHIDGNKQNNNVNNLEWVTRKENMQHARDCNLWFPEKRCCEKHPMSKLTAETVIKIRELLKEGTMSQKDIAIICNTTQERVSRIKHNKAWRAL